MAKTIPGTLVKKKKKQSVSCPGNKMVSLFIIHKNQFSEANDRAVSDGIPQVLRIGQDTAKY